MSSVCIQERLEADTAVSSTGAGLMRSLKLTFAMLSFPECPLGFFGMEIRKNVEQRHSPAMIDRGIYT